MTTSSTMPHCAAPESRRRRPLGWIRRPLLFVLGLLATVSGATPLAAGETSTLTILHTNDFHSRVEPISKLGSDCSEKEFEAGACYGGWARLITAIRENRRDDTILLDAGDQFQGSLFYTHYKGDDTAEFMTLAGYDAMAVGNHEFDDGPSVLARFAQAVPFPLLSANSNFEKEPALKGLIEPSTILEKKGLPRIGIIGLTPRDTGTLTIGGKTVGFSDPVPAVEREVKRLTEEGAGIILVLSHSGYGEDQRIAAAVNGIDAIIGGHSHTYLANPEWEQAQADRRAGTAPAGGAASSPAEIAAGPYPTFVTAPDGRKVAIVQAGSYGKYLGRLTLTLGDTGPRRVVGASGGPILLDASVAEAPAVKARVAELAQPLEDLRHTVVADMAAPVDGSHETCRSAECQMGDLVADAMLDRVKDQGVQIAIANGGGLRASIDAGAVTMGEVLTVLPFQNTLSTFKLKGSEVIAALENGVSKVEEGSGRFPQVAGIEVDWSLEPPGRSRIRAVRVRAGNLLKPIDPAATYLVVSNNFLRGGGDGYAVFAEKGEDAYDYGPTLDSVVVDYLAREGKPYKPYTDGRIRRVK